MPLKSDFFPDWAIFCTCHVAWKNTLLINDSYWVQVQQEFRINSESHSSVSLYNRNFRFRNHGDKLLMNKSFWRQKKIELLAQFSKRNTFPDEEILPVGVDVTFNWSIQTLLQEKSMNSYSDAFMYGNGL